MKSVLALVVLVFGLVIGVWLGLFVLFVPGIIEVVEQCQTGVTPVSLAWAIVKIVFAWPVTAFLLGLSVGINKELLK